MLTVFLAMVGASMCAVAFGPLLKRPILAGARMTQKAKTVEDRMTQYGAAVRARLAPSFKRVGVAYPPLGITLVGLKTERALEVWVEGPSGVWNHLKDYPIRAMSGTLGPKLREGDLQAPEGLYRVELLNPNSLYHLSLRVNYPNAEDRRRGKDDGREKLGSDIMIHGKECSVGCLAMGDEAAEDLFALAAEAGVAKVAIILSPVDFRVRELPSPMPPVPAWTDELYASIRKELATLRGPTVRPVSTRQARGK